MVEANGAEPDISGDDLVALYCYLVPIGRIASCRRQLRRLVYVSPTSPGQKMNTYRASEELSALWEKTAVFPSIAAAHPKFS